MIYVRRNSLDELWEADISPQESGPTQLGEWLPVSQPLLPWGQSILVAGVNLA